MPHVLMVLLLTLQRRSELGLAEWREFDFKGRIWRVPDEHAKNARGHALPLTDTATEELLALKRLAGNSRYVLPNAHGLRAADPKLMTRSIARCETRFRKLGISAFTLHDLRRTGRTGLARLGVERDIAERILNHVQEKIVGTYDVYDYLNEKRNALESWERRLTLLARQAPPKEPEQPLSGSNVHANDNSLQRFRPRAGPKECVAREMQTPSSDHASNTSGGA